MTTNYDFYGSHKYQFYLEQSEIEAFWSDPELGYKVVAQQDPGFWRGARQAARVP